MEALTAPEIFVFLLGDSFSQEVHSHLMNMLAGKSNIKQATNAQEALRLFGQNNCPKGVLVADPGIIKAKNDVSQKLADYVRNGGTLVLGGCFSSHIRPSDLGSYMRGKWDLPWEVGSYHRTTMFLNREVVNRPASGLLSSYSHKAVFLKNVDPNMAWYVATDRSEIESLVPMPGPGIDHSQTSIAFAKFGNGWIGYVGDVNGEQGTTAVVLEMLGLD